MGLLIESYDVTNIRKFNRNQLLFFGNRLKSVIKKVCAIYLWIDSVTL